MSQTSVVDRPPAAVEAEPIAIPDTVPPPDEPGLILGRPLEDRSFEMVEVGAGTIAGLALGTAAGPIGMAVGGLVGAAVGLAAGEALERAVGRAGSTTDASEPDRRSPI